jgi:hypothetical protein
MARKDTQIFIDSVHAQKGSLIVLPAIAAQMDKMIGQGLGASDWTVIAKDAIK